MKTNGSLSKISIHSDKTIHCFPVVGLATVTSNKVVSFVKTNAKSLVKQVYDCHFVLTQMVDGGLGLKPDS